MALNNIWNFFTYLFNNFKIVFRTPMKKDYSDSCNIDNDIEMYYNELNQNRDDSQYEFVMIR
jgi:hypothetical protein